MSDPPNKTFYAEREIQRERDGKRRGERCSCRYMSEMREKCNLVFSNSACICITTTKITYNLDEKIS